ncbi:hypothetical protein CNBG_1052 [Cryptococcus deuterogattii R265]|uniref:Uncharacterized protein n=1 Tax=Cryptococcus deuterogattii (strain R265) TaxID=294750 RepID=A0A095C690_CRYD2|nr:hypothetical protein CNBG_1052 [Cryptococcus deuterogattii R265]KIR75346.1 hypothetical protein I310_00033 [Cryptococcus deuterogattii CA1014]
MVSQPSANIRLYKDRASYSLRAALDIFREGKIAHVAFVHPGDEEGEGTKRRKETIMNIPLITVLVCEGEDEDDQDSYVVYLHSHKYSGLVEASTRGRGNFTATTTRIDGLVLSPTAHDHSLNYRSATLHLHEPVVLSDETDHEEKRAALAAITNTILGYDRISSVGQPMDANVKSTTVIRCKIAAVSCKQRYGAFNGGKEPVTEVIHGEEGNAFKGVIPCWTQWGDLIGFGNDSEELEELFKIRNEEAKAFAQKSAWAHEDGAIEGLGKKRKPVTRL